MHWLSILIPFIIIAFFKIACKKEITWPKFLASMLAPIAVCIAFTMIYTHFITQDEKLVSGYVVGKEYVPAHSETRTGVTTDSKGNAHTYTYTVYISDRWTAFISENKYVPTERRRAAYGGDAYGEEGSPISIEHEKYDTLELGEPAAWIEQFTNNLKKTKTSLYRRSDSKKYPNVEMPEIYDGWYVNRVVALNGVRVPNVNKQVNIANSLLSRTNINFGFIITTYPDDFPKYLENKWTGGNPNDFIVVIGTDPQGSIKYASPIAWGNEYLKVKVRDDILNAVPNVKDLGKAVQMVYADVKKSGFTEEDFNKFDYLQVNFPPNILILLYIINIIICCIIMVVEVEKADEDAYPYSG